MRRTLFLFACAAAVAAIGVAAALAADQRVETRDWILVAPTELGSLADLDLNARGAQICTDELKKLLGYRRVGTKFTMRWLPGDRGVSFASYRSVSNYYTPGFRLVDDAARPFRQSLVAQGICFGPHEITHVLTWGSLPAAWVSEGFAEFTDRLYESTTWRCCAQPVVPTQRCDDTGYTWKGDRYEYSDLSPFAVGSGSYNTAACFWWEAHRIGGFPAIRALLESMRTRRPVTTGELAVQHANVVLGVDVRPVLHRYGFTPGELAAPPAPTVPRVCTRLGTDARDVLTGTQGADVLCGAGGPDRITGLGGADVFRAGPGNDVLYARDGVADAVACGIGRDTVVADRRDRVSRDCERVARR